MMKMKKFRKISQFAVKGTNEHESSVYEPLAINYKLADK